MHLHYMLIWILILERKGGDTNNGLTVALNHNTTETKAVEFGIFGSHGWGNTGGELRDPCVMSQKMTDLHHMEREGREEGKGNQSNGTAQGQMPCC